MFSQGTSFKSLNLSIEAPSGARSSFRSLEHLDKVSRHYISEIIQKAHPLSSDERHLLSIIINSNFNFRHQSNSNLSNNILNIKSFDKIQSKNIQTHKNTYSEDIKPRFCFFGVEVSLDRIINFVFQLEYHIPRMLSTDNFKKIKLRDISLEDAIKASNYEEINNKVTDKKWLIRPLLIL